MVGKSENKIVMIENMENKDLLNRQEFVDKMLLITELVSNNKGSVRYAINGSWGIGKSFVLDMFEQQLEEKQQEENATDKYCLFHYNCWNYDYYDEPLVAIVSSMLDQIEANEKLIPEKIRTRVKAIFKIVGTGLASKAIGLVSEKTGVNLKDVVDVVTTSKNISDREFEEKYNFDEYFSFKKVLSSLKETIKSIAQEKTVVFVVDELDRCLPEYAIKVLERLHHMFEGIPNAQIVIAIDKSQFGNVIGQIFGSDTNVDKYFAKFIDFELNLDEGNFNDEFDAKFEYYLGCFEYLSNGTKEEDIKAFKNHIFNGMDIRSRIKLIDKCNLLHNILNPQDQKLDFAFMCVEVSFLVMKYWGIELSDKNSFLYISNIFNINLDENRTGLKFLNQMVYNNPSGEIYYASGTDDFGRTVERLRRSDIWGVILTSYRYVLGYKKDNFSRYDSYCGIGLRKYSETYRDLMCVIG